MVRQAMVHMYLVMKLYRIDVAKAMLTMSVLDIIQFSSFHYSYPYWPSASLKLQ